tara:strand:- start:1116 stop:1283 length:168 start_codon:yes stop_codon:yes gene_type:complete
MKKSIGLSILLIITGVLFLLDNLSYLDISIANLIKTYWPIILIWIGAEKLYRDLK